MLRMKYKLYNGQTPNDAIVAAVPSIDQETDLFLGQFYDDDWMYGDIDTDSENQSTLETALSDWQVSFFATDQAAKDYVDAIIPAGTVLQQKKTSQAAEIDGNSRLVKPVQTHED